MQAGGHNMQHTPQDRNMSPLTTIDTARSYVASTQWWSSCRTEGTKLLTIFYRDCQCQSSEAYLISINNAWDQWERLGISAVYGICSDHHEAISEQQSRLNLKFTLLQCPGNKLAHHLSSSGIADVTISLTSRVGFRGGTIQPCVVCMHGERILYSFAKGDHACLSFPPQPEEDWPPVNSIIRCVEEELSDDAPLIAQTPRSEPSYLGDMFGLATFFKALGSPF